ncbi:MAG: phosphoribosylanthranilate isomerase [Isosphaeraceae bacterium]
MNRLLLPGPCEATWPSGVFVKICGVTRVDDALACVEAGANFLGLNFHPRSPRSTTLEQAAAIVAALPATVWPVGVFVEHGPAEVAAIAREVGLRWVQLHYDAPPASLAPLEGLTVVPAFRLADDASFARMDAFLAHPYSDPADTNDPGRPYPYRFLLADSLVAGLHGGTGKLIESAALDRLRGDRDHAICLAGGLNPENVAERINRLHPLVPYMVDVASGVESSPGRKDPARVAAFVAAARQAIKTAASGSSETSPAVP